MSNHGGWQSGGVAGNGSSKVQDLLDLDDPQIALLRDCVALVAKEYVQRAQVVPDFRLVPPAEEFRIEIHSSWASVNSHNDWNARHIHPRMDLSGVFYVSTERAGLLALEDPRPQATPWMAPGLSSLHSGEVVHISPEPGLFVLFPSWVPHSVMPSHSAKPRIGISFNIKIHPRSAAKVCHLPPMHRATLPHQLVHGSTKAPMLSPPVWGIAPELGSELHLMYATPFLTHIVPPEVVSTLLDVVLEMQRAQESDALLKGQPGADAIWTSGDIMTSRHAPTIARSVQVLEMLGQEFVTTLLRQGASKIQLSRSLATMRGHVHRKGGMRAPARARQEPGMSLCGVLGLSGARGQQGAVRLPAPLLTTMVWQDRWLSLGAGETVLFPSWQVIYMHPNAEPAKRVWLEFCMYTEVSSGM